MDYILAFTGAGISKASGIPTFNRNPRGFPVLNAAGVGRGGIAAYKYIN